MPPEVLSVEDKEFSILSALTNTVVTVDRKSPIKDAFKVASESYFNRIFEMCGVKGKEGINRFLRKQWEEEALRNTNSSVRGVGIYADEDGYVANLKGGRFVLQNGKIIPTEECKPISNKTYVSIPYEKDLPDIQKSTFGTEEIKTLKKLWSDTYHLDDIGLLAFLGFIVQAAYSSFSPHRAHLWLLAPSGSGKSVILNFFVRYLAESFALQLDNATVGGVNQMLSPEDGSQNHTLLTIDEMGLDRTAQKAQRVLGIIELSREVAGNKGNAIAIRGTQYQKAKVYRRSTAMMFSSTTHSLDDPQDISRFIFFDLEKGFKHAGADQFKILEETLQTIAPAFLNTLISGASDFEELFNLICAKLREEETDKHLTHKIVALASVLSGAAVLSSLPMILRQMKKQRVRLLQFVNDLLQNKLTNIRRN